MGNMIVKAQTEQVEEFLGNVVKQLNTFLNQSTISSFLDETAGDEMYYEDLFRNLRRLSVYCEEGLEACRIVLQNEPFRKPAAEKALYKIYHQCIEEFYNPKNDVWYEDSRSAYTGKNAIKYRHPAPDTLKAMIASLESGFQEIREELEYYETDYRTKMIQSK
ncbi:YpuI family protein [Bacillus sp. F19]|nr:YpuI family protein [Bacillus sp. F19]